MKVTIKTSDKILEFTDSSVITIGSDKGCDLCINCENVFIKLIYTEKYKNYVIVNSSENKDILCNGKSFSKALLPPYFSLEIGKETILVTLEEILEEIPVSVHNKTSENYESEKPVSITRKSAMDIFNNQIEKNRVSIVKEIGFKTEELKNSVKNLNNANLILNLALVILSVVCSFGVTNLLLGLRVDITSSVLNLTTNFGFMVCMSAVIFAISLIMRYGIYTLLDFNKNKKLGDSDIAQKFIIFISSIFLFMVYVINLFYYKDIPGFGAVAFFIAVLFVGALTSVAISGGYLNFRLKSESQELTNYEFREDFESVLKEYRKLIEAFVNSLSANRISSVKSTLLNNQMRMILETTVGLLTAPFLAYGVSNTLASCFPEAANWVRISGLRFSPIFLTLATFLIIFAFFVFVTAFTITKRVKSSEIIKFDGFHDYNSHGVSILGIDATKSLIKERTTLLFIACSIILIEFTMNVSYFVSEIGGDIQGMFLSLITALVPTALLIAETNLLSSTMHRIHNYNELLAMLD